MRGFDVWQWHITNTMTTDGSTSYISTVKSDGNEFYQPTTTVGAANGSSYRVTDMYLGGPEEQQEIQRVCETGYD